MLRLLSTQTLPKLPVTFIQTIRIKLENVILFFFLGRMKEAVTKKQDYVIDKTSPSTCDKSGNRD